MIPDLKCAYPQVYEPEHLGVRGKNLNKCGKRHIRQLCKARYKSKVVKLIERYDVAEWILFVIQRSKGKSVPLQSWSGPEGSRKLRFLDNVTMAQDGCQPYAPAAFTPRKYSWYSFLLEAESTPGP